MIPFDEARAFVLDRCPPPVSERVALRGVRGLVAAEAQATGTPVVAAAVGTVRVAAGSLF